MSADSDRPDRREFLRRGVRLTALATVTTGAGVWLRGRSARPAGVQATAVKQRVAIAADPRFPELVVVEGESPAAIARRAIEEIGGIRRFVTAGDVVVLKPNIGWDRAPEQAANTNPELVAEMVRLCREAGAKRVVVTDVSCNDAAPSFERSGIAAAAKGAGAEVILPEPRRFREVDLGGQMLHVWPVLEPILEADKIINLPIAKHHSLTGVTLGMKNWYGLLGGARARLHQRIHEGLVDLAAFAKPALTVVDGYRVLMHNGPTGGSLGDVQLRKTVLVSTDPVQADAMSAAMFFDMAAPRLMYLRLAEERGLGRMAGDESRIKRVKV